MASELLTRDLYNGLYHIVHNPTAKGRQPRYVVNDTRPKGVTTILGSTLAKDFVSWALNCMEDVLQSKWPTISMEDIAFAKAESARRRDSGAGTGTEAHALVEKYLKGTSQLDLSEVSTEALQAYKAFVEWFETVGPTVINVEEVIFSETWGFCGTYDCMLEIEGKVYLCDLKTTNASRNAPQGVYAENFLQLGAYALAHEEQRKYEEQHGGTTLRPIDDLMVISARKDGQLSIVTASDMGLGVKVCGVLFTKVVELYQFIDSVAKSLKERR